MLTVTPLQDLQRRMRKKVGLTNRGISVKRTTRTFGFTTSLRDACSGIVRSSIIAVRCLTFRQDERFAPTAHSPDPEKDQVGDADGHSPTSSPALGAKLRP
jgi:hypothetical protein